MHFLNCKNEAEIVGQGTVDAKAHLDALREENVKMFVSGMSSKACGYDQNLSEDYNAEFTMPSTLISQFINTDSLLCYSQTEIFPINKYY